MRRLIITVLLAGLSSVVCAGPEGRYTAVAVDSGLDFGAEKVLLLDTVAGHVWVWVESPAVNDEPGGRYMIYQGQLEPGKQMGEVIQKQEWASPDAAQ